MDDQQRQQVAESVREAMRQRGLSQEALAARAGVAPNTVLSFLKGNPAHGGTVRKILDALGVEEPAPVSLSMEGVPEDVQAFLRVVTKRLSRLGDADRDRVLARLYRHVLEDEIDTD
jgi:transcriptional regulator with XRE-family HTH domain